MVRAVFLDRDGVINEATVRNGKPYAPQQLKDFILLGGVREACRQLKEAGFTLIVVTNQPDVGRGLMARTVVEDMHEMMCRELPIDRVDVCYDAGDAPSEFRKPAPGMLLRAAHELGIDLRMSYLIGDRWRDINCGVSAGCRTIFVDRKYHEPLREMPEFRVNDLPAAAALILQLEKAANAL